MGYFRDLHAWRHARTLAIECARASLRFPHYERYGLASQLRRAAFGAMLNITEGASRRGPREFRKYLDDARASLHEVDAVLDVSRELEYLPAVEIDRLEALRAEAARTTFGLLTAITKKCDKKKKRREDDTT